MIKIKIRLTQTSILSLLTLIFLFLLTNIYYLYFALSEQAIRILVLVAVVTCVDLYSFIYSKIDDYFNNLYLEKKWKK